MSSKPNEWEKKLSRLRKERGSRPEADSAATAPEAETAGKAEAGRKTEPARKPRNRRAHSGYQQQILQNYLKKWEKQHNAMLAGELTDAEATVLLVEDWLSAQHALQGNVKPEKVKEKQTVWLSPQPPAGLTGVQQNEDGTTKEREYVFDPQDVPVSVNVLDPQGVPSASPVFCISEEELSRRLMELLMPHLTDAVNGLVRTAVNRQLAVLSHQVYRSIEADMSELVKETFDYNLKKVLTELKYQTKYKK